MPQTTHRTRPHFSFCYLTLLCPFPESLDHTISGNTFSTLYSVHSFSHPGIRASRHLISERFVWEGMQKDIAEYTRACVPCQQSKIHRHNSSPLQSFLQPDSRFSAIQCDLVGPLPESCSCAYLLTIIDRFTSHLECIPLSKITAKACANALVLYWVARFGCPLVMTCDRGVQFTSYLWAELSKFLGCKLVYSTSFHPAGNGFLECQHETMKAALKAQENPRDWFSNLGFVFVGIRSTPKSDFEVSSAQLCLETSLRLPGQFLIPFPRLLNPNTALNFASLCRPSKFHPLTIMAHHVHMLIKHSRPAHTSLSRTTPPAPRLMELTKAYTGC